LDRRAPVLGWRVRDAALPRSAGSRATLRHRLEAFRQPAEGQGQAAPRRAAMALGSLSARAGMGRALVIVSVGFDPQHQRAEGSGINHLHAHFDVCVEGWDATFARRAACVQHLDALD